MTSQDTSNTKQGREAPRPDITEIHNPSSCQGCRTNSRFPGAFNLDEDVDSQSLEW